MFDPNNFILCSMFSFQNTLPVKRKAVYPYNKYFSVYSFISFIGLENNSHFFKTSYLTTVEFQ